MSAIVRPAVIMIVLLFGAGFALADGDQGLNYEEQSPQIPGEEVTETPATAWQYIVTIANNTDMAVVHRDSCSRIEEPGLVVLGRYATMQEAIQKIRTIDRKPLLCDSESWTAVEYATYQSLMCSAAQPPSIESNNGKPASAATGISLGVMFERSLFNVMTSAKTDWRWTYNDSSTPELNFKFTDEAGMPVPSEFLVLLELGYRAKRFFVLANYNIIPQVLTDRLTVIDEDSDSGHHGSLDFNKRYTIEYSRIGLRAGYYFSEKRGRPFVNGTLGVDIMKFSFEDDYVDLKFDNLTSMDCGLGGGYEYTINKGFGVGGSADVRYMFGRFSGKDKYGEYDAESNDDVTLDFQLMPVSVQAYLFYAF